VFAMQRWKWALLIFELVLFALILVLPQVDLPDFAFHGGTSPVAARTRLSSSPARGAIVLSSRILLPAPVVEAGSMDSGTPSPSSSESRLSMLCILLC